MKITMTKSAIGVVFEDGSATSTYLLGEEYESQGKWQDEIFKGFIDSGQAHEIGGNAAPIETKIVRARASDGRLKGDDPSTPNVNEAWEGGASPKSKT